ncbi:MAG: four helix bundle protein [Candidatus Margulisiibacteriota bacterium]|jgi:four helix bundle protein
MESFQELKVWQKAHLLVICVYRATKVFPSEEKFGLTSQIRRSAASVPANIVEGYRRKSDKVLNNFLNIAAGSLEETKYHLILARDLNYFDVKVFAELFGNCEEVGRMINGLQKRLIT